ncbi:18028_t:CDS:1, partial [Gigaspora margarita]
NEDMPSLIESFQILKKIYKQQATNSIFAESSSKKDFYSYVFGLCKKALYIVIANSYNQILENLLQLFINEQVLTQSKSTQELFKQELNQEIDNLNISNLFQHKDKDHLGKQK